MLRSDYGPVQDFRFGAFKGHIEEGAYQFKLKQNPDMELRTDLNLLAMGLSTKRVVKTESQFPEAGNIDLVLDRPLFDSSRMLSINAR